MKKVKLFFNRTVYYGDRVFNAGEEHELTEERPGFIQRFIKRGAVEVNQEAKAEVKKDEQVVSSGESKEPVKKKTTKKKTTKSKPLED